MKSNQSIWIAAVVSLGGFLFGFDAAIISGPATTGLITFAMIGFQQWEANKQLMLKEGPENTYIRLFSVGEKRAVMMYRHTNIAYLNKSTSPDLDSETVSSPFKYS